MTRNLKIEMITKMDDTKLFCIRLIGLDEFLGFKKALQMFHLPESSSNQNKNLNFDVRSGIQNIFSFTWTAAHQKTLALVDSEVCRKRSSLNR